MSKSQILNGNVRNGVGSAMLGNNEKSEKWQTDDSIYFFRMTTIDRNLHKKISDGSGEFC